MHESTTVQVSRQSLRDKIMPFGGWSAEKKTFPVGWKAKPIGFEEIINDLKLLIANDLVYFRKIASKHIPDLLQQGWLRLWQALHEDANLLLSMTCRKAADFVSNRCGATTLRDYLKRYDSYHQLSKWNEADAENYEDSITAIVIGSSLKSSGRGRHAFFTRVTDRMVDIETAIRKAAAWCGDNIKKLAALYYVTTSVSQVDAGRIAGLAIRERKDRNPYCPNLQYWTRKVLQYLREVLASYQPIEPNRHIWKERLKAGDTEPVQQLAEKYAEDEFSLLALYVLTTRVAGHIIVKELGVDESKLWYAMKQLREELRCLYARRELGRT